MKSLKIFFYTLLSLFFIYVLAGFFLIPHLAKKEIIAALDRNLTTKTDIKEIFFNPFTLFIDIKDFALLNDKDEKVVAFNTLSVRPSFLISLEKKHIRIKDINLDGIYLNIIEENDGVLNIASIVKEDDKIKEEKEPSTLDIKFLISKILVKNAYIDFTSFKDKQQYSFNLKDINYAIYDFGTYKNSLSSNDLEFILNETTKIKIAGGIKLEPFVAYGQLQIEDLRIKDILNFNKSLFNFDINSSANSNIILNYHLDFKDDLSLFLNSDKFELNDIQLSQNKSVVATLNKLDIKKFNFDLNLQKIDFDDITLNKLNLNILQEKNGLNLAKLINSPKNSNKNDAKNSKEENKPWIVNLNKVAIDSKTSFKDRENNIDLEFKNIALRVDNINVINSDVALQNINLNLKDTTFKDTKSNFDISNKDLNLNIDKVNILENIDFQTANLKLQNFSFQDKNSKISLNSKNFSLKTSNFLLDKTNDIKIENIVANNFDINFFDANSSFDIKSEKSDINLSGFELNKDILRVKNFELKNQHSKIVNLNSNLKIEAKHIDIALKDILNKENLLKIEKSTINKPYLAVIIPKDKKENNQEQIKEEIKEQNSQNSNFKLSLGPVNIKDMTFEFEDRNLPIEFKTVVTKLNGSIIEKTENKEQILKIDIKGVVDDYGVANILGKLNPNNIKHSTNINMNFKNISIKNFTPYSAKFVGREIKDGKLQLDLKYDILNSNLKASNSIIINKIILGNKVDSKDAVSLPLDLAITLLEDSSNTIDINLPVSGNIDDPQFSISSIIWKAFFNIVTKAITSPFSLLSSMFNFSEDEIKSVNFDLTQSEITPIQQETLDKIAVILTKKDDLAITLTPAFIDKKESNSIADDRVKNIKDYLVIEKNIKEKQLVIEKDIKNNSSNINLNIKQLK